MIRDSHGKFLLVINYAMDSSHPIFAHQIEVVRRLASYFEGIHVITNSLSEKEILPKNVHVHVADWRNDSNLRNATRFMILFYTVARRLQKFAIFSHMTEVQSFLIAPFVWLKSIPHFLWYAHKSNSPYLRFAYPFLSGVITSTSGSCPIKSRKVSLIGQGVDETIFLRQDFLIYSPKQKLRAISIGRIDPSKRIEEIIENTVVGKFSNSFDSLTLIGSSSLENKSYEQSLIDSYAAYTSRGLISFEGKVKRDELPNCMDRSDVFVHAFFGSLDKTLVEATLYGLPVITSNMEYLKEFGSWTPNWKSGTTLSHQVESFLALSSEDVRSEVIRRQKVAIQKHSLSGWIERLMILLGSVS